MCGSACRACPKDLPQTVLCPNHASLSRHRRYCWRRGQTAFGQANLCRAVFAVGRVFLCGPAQRAQDGGIAAPLYSQGSGSFRCRPPEPRCHFFSFAVSGPALFLISLLDTGGPRWPSARAFQLVLCTDVAGVAATVAATLLNPAFGSKKVVGVAMSVMWAPLKIESFAFFGIARC